MITSAYKSESLRHKLSNHFYFVLMQQLKSEVEGLRKEVKRLELENASKHAELVDTKLSKQSNLKTMYIM